MVFEITLDSHAFRTDDLTLDEAVAVEKATGTSWLYINPLRSAADCRALLVAFLSRNMSKAAAEERVKKLGMKEAIAAVSRVEEDLPDEYEDGLPKAVGDPSTTT